MVIDDYLPTICCRPLYMASTEKNEFWSALLEKAYAKLHGCYQNLEGGYCRNAMEDLSGGLSELFPLSDTDKPDNTFNILKKACDRGSLMCTSTPGTGENKNKTGLISGHAYTISNVIELETSSGIQRLIKIRNPWGGK